MNRYMAIVIGGVLGGCAAPAGPAAGTQFDGSYAGQNTLVRGGGYLCGATSYPERLTVRGGRFDYPFAVNPPRTVPHPGADRRGRHVRGANAVRHRGLRAAVAVPDRLGDRHRTHRRRNARRDD